MYQINHLSSRKILDSRSKWTIETTVDVNGVLGVASVPSGTSVGKFEAVSFDAEKSLKNIAEVNKEILLKKFSDQKELDAYLIKLDGTENKAKIGGNVLLSISCAFARAVSKTQKTPLHKYLNLSLEGTVREKIPQIMMLMFEGGLHGGKGISIQEFMVMADSVNSGDTVYNKIKDYLTIHNLPLEVGLEGAFSPVGLDNFSVLNILKDISSAPLALDIANSSTDKNANSLDYDYLLSCYPIVSIEDPFGEEDWVKWTVFTKKYANKILIVADDLVTTNVQRIKKAVKFKACNAVIIKPNQIGTVSETLEAVSFAKNSGMKIVVSHRSGETNDSFIADLAVGVGADFVKFGAPARGERVAKYNRLLEIQSSLV